MQAFRVAGLGVAFLLVAVCHGSGDTPMERASLSPSDGTEPVSFTF